MPTLPAPDAVGALLHARDTRSAILDVLEAAAEPMPAPLANAAALELGELLALSADDVEEATYRRLHLLIVRMARHDPAGVLGAAFGCGRWLAMWRAEDSTLGRLARKSHAELDSDDALSYAAAWACEASLSTRGWTAPVHAMGMTVPEFMGTTLSLEPIITAPSDDVPLQMMSLLLQALRNSEGLSGRPEGLPDVWINGVWRALGFSLNGREAVAKRAVDLGVFEVAVIALRALGSTTDRMVRVHNMCTGLRLSTQIRVVFCHNNSR
jgi:hypothetical protein